MTDLFNGAAPTQVPQVDPNKNYLEDLVGEGKKYKTPEELAKSRIHADLHIANLEKELEGLRQEFSQTKRLGDLVDQLANLNKPADPPKPVITPGDETPGTSLDPAKLEEMVQNLLSQREQQSLAQRNLNEVKNRLTEAFGPGYPEKLSQKANELGLSKEALNELAAKSPAAFYTLVGVSGQEQAKPSNGFVPPASTRSPANSSGNPVDRTKSFYDNLKKTNPVLYWDKSTQQAMHKDAIRLGAAFFDN